MDELTLIDKVETGSRALTASIQIVKEQIIFKLYSGIKQIKFLGHIISPEGIRSDPDKYLL